MPDEGRTYEGEADTAVSTHPGHARPAAGDRSLHAHHWSLQVDQAQVRGNPDRMSFNSLLPARVEKSKKLNS